MACVGNIKIGINIFFLIYVLVVAGNYLTGACTCNREICINVFLGSFLYNSSGG